MTATQVKLLPYAAGMAVAYYEAVQESVDEVGRWLTWCSKQYTLADAEAWIAGAAAMRLEVDEEQHFAIEAGGRYAGSISLNRLDEAHATANVGYWVRTSLAGKGIATEALRLLAQMAFKELGLGRIEIFMSARNQASKRVAEKAGALVEGYMRDRLRYADGPHDAFLYAMTRN